MYIRNSVIYVQKQKTGIVNSKETINNGSNSSARVKVTMKYRDWTETENDFL